MLIFAKVTVNRQKLKYIQYENAEITCLKGHDVSHDTCRSLVMRQGTYGKFKAFLS